MTKFEKTKEELIQRMDLCIKEHSSFLTLTMKADGEEVFIEPWINDTYSVFFDKVGMSATAKDIDEVVTWLVEYPKKADELASAEDKWVEENKPKLKEFFDKHIDGKGWKDIDEEDWQWYSDYHKDVFGYRPHGIVFGEYINPHC